MYLVRRKTFPSFNGDLMSPQNPVGTATNLRAESKLQTSGVTADER